MSIFSKGKLDQLEANSQVEKKHTILIVDDEEANLVAMSSVLQSSYNLLMANGGQEALDLIKGMSNPESISLVISDQRMPGVTGVMLFQELTVLLPKTIRIIVTGFIDVEAIIDSVNKAHIYRFILKPFERAELLRIIKRAIENFELQQQREEYIQGLEARVAENTQQLEVKRNELDRAYQSMEAINMIDQLTKLNSRSFLLEHLEADLELCVKRHFTWNLGDKSQALTDADMVFFIVSLDQMKYIHDSLGETASDHIMMQMKGILLQTFQETDFLIRWGNQQLLVVARFIDRANAADLAEKLRIAFEQHDFDVPNSAEIDKTCSIGYSCYPFEPLRSQAFTWMQLVDMAAMCHIAAQKTQSNAWVGVKNNSEEQVIGLFERFSQQPDKVVVDGMVSIETSIRDGVQFMW